MDLHSKARMFKLIGYYEYSSRAICAECIDDPLILGR